MKGTSKLRSPHLSAYRPLQRLRGCFLGDNAAVPPAYRVKVSEIKNVQVLLTFLMCVNLQHFVTERVTLSVGVFAIEFWPAWLSPRMRLSSPDHSPLIARTRVLAIFSSCRFSSYNTASGRFYQPGETFMTYLTYSGLCCFLNFFIFLSTERIDERNIKAPIATSKCRPTTSEVAWVFSGR